MKTTKHFKNLVVVNEIEEGALWELIDGNLVLIDIDQHVSVNYENNTLKFTQVQYTPPNK